MDAAEFLGLRQVGRYLFRGEISGNAEGMSEKGLVTTGVYGIVRHPMYLAGIVIFTLEPTITRNGALITVLADLYFLIGCADRGPQVHRAVRAGIQSKYREQVPMLFPLPKRR